MWTYNYLQHHGVPDQKWGVHNGPPYPLDRDKKGNISGHQETLKENSKSSYSKLYKPRYTGSSLDSSRTIYKELKNYNKLNSKLAKDYITGKNKNGNYIILSDEVNKKLEKDTNDWLKKMKSTYKKEYDDYVYSKDQQSSNDYNKLSDAIDNLKTAYIDTNHARTETEKKSIKEIDSLIRKEKESAKTLQKNK